MIAERDLQGHWRRDWLRAADQFDSTTQVHWLQAGALYADIRIPARRPVLTGVGLVDQPPETLRSLMRAEAFAGTTDVSDGICTWHRLVNWHGKPAGIDAGRMSFDGDALIEEGVHAAYTERWIYEGCGFTARRTAFAGFTGVLVENETWFLLVSGRPDAPPSNGLVDELEAGRVPDGLAEHFAPPCLFGEWRGAEGIVRLSTNPFHQGSASLRRDAGGLVLCATDFHGRAKRERLQS